MTVELNHTIVAARDPEASARLLADVLGLAEPARFGPFMVVETSNRVSLVYLETDDEITAQHYAFLVPEEEFDQIFGRIKERELPYWADPGRRRAGEINRNDGGRGVYFPDPMAPAGDHHPALRQRLSAPRSTPTFLTSQVGAGAAWTRTTAARSSAFGANDRTPAGAGIRGLPAGPRP